MADITITCKSCGASLILSEYAKPDNLLCPACKSKMTMPDPQLLNSDRFLPEHLRRAKEEAASMADPDKPEVQLKQISGQIHRKRRSRVRLDKTTLKASLLFAGLTAFLVYLRYFDGFTLFLAPTELDSIKSGGAIALLFFHVVIVIEALTQNFLSGLLCLLVPGYSVYYLFTESDSFWLRAIVLALVIAFGRDFVIYAKDYALSVFTFVSNWLEAGGEFNKPLKIK